MSMPLLARHPAPSPAPAPSQPARPDTTVLARRVRELIRAGRPKAARPLLAALRRIDADGPEIAGLDAQLKLREGDAAGACAVLDAALLALPEGSPLAAGLFKARVEARTALDDHLGACRDAADAVFLDRDDAEAKALLGLTLIHLGQPEDALKCLAEASRAQPVHPSFRLGLAHALELVGDPDAALATLDQGIAFLPGFVALRNAAVLLRVKLDRCEEAIEAAMAARTVGVADACTYGMLGHALSKLGRHEEATSAYADALKLAPEDPYVRHLVAAGGRVAAGERAPVEYVRTLFDGYAGRFEPHLLGLGYRVPGLVRQAVEAQLGDEAEAEAETGTAACAAPTGPVLDLGCGTGLLAVACLGLPLGPWTGVDVSENMLASAREKGLYDELVQDDLVHFLEEDGRSFPLILAGDVFCYFGRLDAPFRAAARRLSPGGAFVLSLERADGGAEAALGQSGRWTHSEAHVRDAAAAAGLCCAGLAHEELRLERDAAVHGMLVVLRQADGT